MNKKKYELDIFLKALNKQPPKPEIENQKLETRNRKPKIQ